MRSTLAFPQAFCRTRDFYSLHFSSSAAVVEDTQSTGTHAISSKRNPSSFERMVHKMRTDTSDT